MSVLGLLIVGIVLVVVAANVSMPAPLNQLCNVLGWILIIVGALLLVLALLGIAAPLGALR